MPEEIKIHNSDANRDCRMALRIAKAVAEAGGRTFYVGGCVRDWISGIDNKDIDIEIHGVTPEKLALILDSLGKRTQMGSSFGIYGMRGYDIDIAMPRKETAIGRGHKDFEVYVDPFLGTKKAAVRRDFTMNALMQDVLSGEIVDHFGGVKDLKAGVLRHVKAETFVEDPLRVLRAAQFAARFGFKVAEETRELAKTMDLRPLARERIMEELKKGLLKSEHPSVFFEEMDAMEQMEVWFPEVKKLQGVEQNPQHHPEGDVWIHTMMTLDMAASLRKQAKEPLGLMLAALTHDFGKVSSSKMVDGKVRSIGHDKEGVAPARSFMKRITNESKLIKYVLNMTALHMRPLALYTGKAKNKSYFVLFDKSVEPDDLLLLSKADYNGRKEIEANLDMEACLKEKLEAYRELMDQPSVMGADLIAAGMRPGPEFSDLLAFAHNLHLSGVNKEDALKQTLAYGKKQKIDEKSE